MAVLLHSLVGKRYESCVFEAAKLPLHFSEACGIQVVDKFLAEGRWQGKTVCNEWVAENEVMVGAKYM